MFGDIVRAHRRRLGLSQEDLARAAVVGVRSIRKIEGGHTLRPRPATARLLADVFGLTGPDRDRFCAAAGPGDPPAVPRSLARVVPRQLPAATRHFVGRSGELRDLDSLLDEVDADDAVVVCVIDGTAGIGKTATAVHWAHQVAARFPDGQLYVNLRGFDPSGSSMEPAEAIRGFLDAFDVAPERIPIGLDAQAALYRSLLDGKRVLVVLDNACNTEQIRPLLPGSAGCLAIATSRNNLAGLVTKEAAHPLTLDLLSDAEARSLLEQRVGSQRISAEHEAVSDIIGACAGLPLALAIVAARAAAHPHFPVRTLANELRHARLDALAGETDIDVRTVFSWSYQQLSPNAQRLFRLLSLHPGPDISAPAAASLAGISPTDMRALLAELTRAHLLTEPTPGRYAFHDVLRAYAAELAHTHDTDEARHDATRRMLDHYLHTAFDGDRLLAPHRDPITLAPPAEGVSPEQFAGYDQAMAWFSSQRPVLLAAVPGAAGAGLEAYTWQLAWGLSTFLTRQGHRRDQVAVCQTALTASQQLSNRREQARAHRDLADAHSWLGSFSDARWHLQQALDLSSQLGDRRGQARAYINLAMSFEREGKYGQALEYLPQALDLYRVSDYQVGQAVAQNLLGWCYAHMGDYEQGLTWSQRALDMFRQLGHQTGEAAAWDSLGYANHHLGRSEIAFDCYRHALNLVRQLGERYNESEALQHLGDAQHTTGDTGAARRSWQQALTILEELDHADADSVRAKLSDLDQISPYGQEPT